MKISVQELYVEGTQLSKTATNLQVMADNQELLFSQLVLNEDEVILKDK